MTKLLMHERRESPTYVREKRTMKEPKNLDRGLILEKRTVRGHVCRDFGRMQCRSLCYKSFMLNIGFKDENFTHARAALFDNLYKGKRTSGEPNNIRKSLIMSSLLSLSGNNTKIVENRS